MKSMKTSLLTAALIVFCFTSNSQTCHESGPQPHAMAPIGIMGGHTHSKGHFMASYRYMFMRMNGLSEQGQSISSEQALSSYMMAPTNMDMQMHMVGLMYAPFDRLTLGLMTNYQTSVMGMESMSSHSEHAHHGHDHSTSSSATMDMSGSTMSNTGFGDTRLAGLIRLNQSPDHCLHAIVALNLPTGGIKAGDEMHAIMPYGMQNGTGSLGALLGLNYSWLMSKYLIGGQITASSPLHDNKRGYMRPATANLSFWGARKWTSWMSTSIRVRGRAQGAVRGLDVLIDPMMSPAGDGANEELYFADVHLGVNLRPFDQWRVAFEAGHVIHQYNAGMHLDNQWMATAGLQFMMH